MRPGRAAIGDPDLLGLPSPGGCRCAEGERPTRVLGTIRPDRGEAAGAPAGRQLPPRAVLAGRCRRPG